LVRTAEANGCSLVIKLHPFESFRERSHLVNGVIPSESQPRVTVVAGALTETLLGETWFGVTVSSTTALDCAIRGVPAFICMWLDHHGFRYADHFVKFGVARALHRREEITEIPSILESICPASIRDLWKPLIPEHLTELLAAEEAARLV
jgi:capsule polysaccharide modification protein KpsS